MNKQRYMVHDAHSARGAITRSSGELGVTLTQLLFKSF